jgi:peroxiredoxin
MKLKKLSSLFALSLILVTWACSKSLPAGEAAPDFTLPNSKGSQVKLADQKGKYVVLEWFNDGCPYVKKHYGSGNMQKLQEKYTGKGVEWFTILSSAPGKQGHQTPQKINEIMVEWKGKPSQVLLDPMGKVGRLYGAKTTPHMFIINPEGNIIYQGAIDSISSTDPADIPQAQNYVALALDSAMAGKPVATASTTPYGCSVKYQ